MNTDLLWFVERVGALVVGAIIATVSVYAIHERHRGSVMQSELWGRWLMYGFLGSMALGAVVAWI